LLRAENTALPGTPVDTIRFTAALEIVPGNNGEALRIARFWPVDPIVVNELTRLQQSGDLGAMPSKADAAREAWNLARRPMAAEKDKIAALKVFCEIMGYIDPDTDPGANRASLPPQPEYKLV
jgi:hypothetical protein